MQCGLQKLVITQYISQEETNISINCMFRHRVGATYGQMVLSKFSGITCFPDGSVFTDNVFPYNSDPDTGQTQSRSEGILVTNVPFFLPAPSLGVRSTNHWRETFLILKIGFRVTEDPPAFILICWLLAPVIDHSCDRAGQAGRASCRRAHALPGGPVSSMDRASAWWDLGQHPAPLKPGWPQAPLCTETVHSMHGAHLLSSISGHSPTLWLCPPILQRQNHRII